MRALIIDDSRAIRTLLCGLMGEIGFEVYQAKDGQDALQKVKELEKLDLCLVDWNMPVMSGYDFVKEIRKEPGYNDMRLMMVTTETEQTQVIKALEAGADEYVMKPFNKEIVLEKLAILGLDIRGGN